MVVVDRQVVPSELYIAGKERPASDSSTFDVLDP